MRNDTINRLTIVGTGLLALLVFGALCVRHNVPAIEAELAARAGAALANERMSWASLDMDGRDAILSGTAPDAEAREAALRVASVAGVRRVDHRLVTVAAQPAANGSRAQLQQDGAAPPSAAPVPYLTRVSVAQGRVVLEGAAPGEIERRTLVRRAQDAFGIAAVEARLEVQPDPPRGWDRAAGAALDIAQHLVLGEVVIERAKFAVTGMTEDRSSEQFVREALASSLPEHWSVSLQTSSRDELDEALRESPSLAERLAPTGSEPGAALPRSLPVLETAACEAEFRQRLGDRRVLFATASTTLTDDSRNLLSDLAAVLKRCPAARLAIEGHTDDQGLRENNLALSQRRAEEVMLYLVGEGIGIGRLSARGFGEERPLVANETAAARARNRRIEFVFEG